MLINRSEKPSAFVKAPTLIGSQSRNLSAVKVEIS